MKEKQKGITLIALVITIIVLLILAGVTIAAISGDNGILQNAGKAKEKTTKSALDEEYKLAKTELYIEYNATGSSCTRLLPNGNMLYIDINGDIAIIPEGFSISEISGEKAIKDGLVIYDIPNSESQIINWLEDIDNDGILDVQTKYNQFVWIPVDNEDNYVRNISFEHFDISRTAIDDDFYLPDGISNEKESVMLVGGFYIARYETGKGENNSVESKKNVSVWTDISYIDAKEKSKSLVYKKYTKSALCSGIQWDVVMNFVNGKYDGINQIFNVNEALNIRHSKTPQLSGKNEADKVCNIYDLEGNFYEFVAEKTTFDLSMPYVGRGGYYPDSISASYRRYHDGKEGVNRAFRIVLYVTNI